MGERVMWSNLDRMVSYRESSFKMVQEDSGSVGGRLRSQSMVESERMAFDKQVKNVKQRSTVRGGGK